MIYVSIDPGKTGAITVMQTSPDDEVRLLEIHKMPDTEQNIMKIFKEFPFAMKCIIEAQHAFPVWVLKLNGHLHSIMDS